MIGKPSAVNCLGEDSYAASPLAFRRPPVQDQIFRVGDVVDQLRHAFGEGSVRQYDFPQVNSVRAKPARHVGHEPGGREPEVHKGLLQCAMAFASLLGNAG